MELTRLLPKTAIGKMFFWSIIAFVVLSYLIPLVHELGHAAVCSVSGHEYRIGFLFTGEAKFTICRDAPFSLTLYHVSGGIAAAAVAGAVAFIPKRKTLFIAAFPFVPQQVIIAGTETLANTWYNSTQGMSVLTPIMTMVSICLFLVLVLSHRKTMIQGQSTNGGKYEE